MKKKTIYTFFSYTHHYRVQMYCICITSCKGRYLHVVLTPITSTSTPTDYPNTISVVMNVNICLLFFNRLRNLIATVLFFLRNMLCKSSC